MNSVKLKTGRSKLANNRHPWIYSGAVADISGSPAAGEIVEVTDSKGTFVALAHYHPHSKIILRLLDWQQGRKIDSDWLTTRLQQAFALRNAVIPPETNACRMVNSEADGLPGLIIDRYAEVLIIQLLTPGMEKMKPLLVPLLQAMLPECPFMLERSDGDGRKMEGLPMRREWISSAQHDEKVKITEAGVCFWVNINSQKTGFFNDQRTNRQRVAAFTRRGGEVLDICSYSGGFAIHALLRGAEHATLCDRSLNALELAVENAQLNGIAPERLDTNNQDMFSFLRDMTLTRKQYDLVILDPPKLIPARAHTKRGERAYKDLNMHALQLVTPGGFIASFSCSGALDAAMFLKIMAFAAKDAGRDVQMVEQLTQSPDHPVLLSVPETAYLKGVIARVL